MHTLTLNQNQAHILLVACEATPVRGLTVGDLPACKTLLTKLNIPGVDRRTFQHEMLVDTPVELEDKELKLLKAFWEGFDVGLMPRGGNILDLMLALNEYLKTVS